MNLKSIRRLALILCVIHLGCVDVTPYERALLDFRKEKDVFFKNYPESPLPDSIKRIFKGLAYYPIREEFKLNCKVILRQEESDTAGTVSFSWQGKTYQLTVFWEDSTKKQFFLPFHDLTNGTTTYGGGRYLNIPYEGKPVIVLDFNYAYHPYCVYNVNYVCKKPPKENTLDFEVLAGEKLPEFY